MKIVGGRKDYYDYVVRYGVDPRCTYRRGKIAKHGLTVDLPGDSPLLRSFRPDDALADRKSGRRLEYVVAGPHYRAYVVRYREIWEAHKSFSGYLKEVDSRRRIDPAADEGLFHRFLSEGRSACPVPPSEGDLRDIVRRVGHPVFRIKYVSREWDGRCALHVDENVPVLADWGFPAEVPAEQMWQDIYVTLTSVLRDDPDKRPPVEVGNEYKIWAAGMDPKTSFRHPVNPRPKRDRRKKS